MTVLDSLYQVRIYASTKAAIEAISGLGEGTIAYATDTDELGSYNGSVWTWGQGASATVGLLDYKGSINCLANPDYPAASKGDVYTASTGGKIGGASGNYIDAGDMILAIADNAGGDAGTVGASWRRFSANFNFNPANDDIIQRKAGAWINRTMAQLAADLQASLNSVYQASDSDLTAIAGLSPSNDDVIQRKAGAWINRTMAQLAADLASALGTVSWNNVGSFSNSWVNYGGAEPVAQYGKDGLGRLFLKGTIKSGTTGATAFTLPVGYRPSEKKSLLALSSGGNTYLDINTDGTVVPFGTSAPSYFVLMGSTPLT